MGKSKKSKTTKSSRSRKSSQTETLQPADYFYNGSDEFKLPNGDTYVGEYCAHRNGMIWREGRGTYYTLDGHKYEGQWRDDKVIDLTPITIEYPNGDVFEGTLSKNKYKRGGEVVFKDGLRLTANFEGNKPIGTFHVIDTQGQLWKGDSNPEQSSMIYCRPEQVFFSNIHPLRGVTKDKLKEIEPYWAPKGSKSPSYSTIGEDPIETYIHKPDLEDMIFSKKPKVSTTMDWEDSPWYQEFAQFKRQREIVLSKMQSSQRLSPEELKWYCRYALSKRNRRKLTKDTEDVDRTLLDTFYNKEYRKGATPYNTFYPSYYWHTHAEEPEEDTSQELRTQMDEMSTVEEEASLAECVGSVETLAEEEYAKSPNPSIACGTNSLYKFLREATGAKITNSCESVF